MCVQHQHSTLNGALAHAKQCNSHNSIGASPLTARCLCQMCPCILGACLTHSNQLKDHVLTFIQYASSRVPHRGLCRIVSLLERVDQGSQVVATEPIEILEDVTAPRRESDITAWVNVIHGCNEKCTYCVVPNTRGREQSRSPDNIRVRAPTPHHLGARSSASVALCIRLVCSLVRAHGTACGVCAFRPLHDGARLCCVLAAHRGAAAS